MIPRLNEPSAIPDGDQKEVLARDVPQARRRVMSWLVKTLALVGLGLALLAAVGIHIFGSAASAPAYLRGDGLIPDAYTKSFGTDWEGDRASVAFSLRNYTEEPIRVLGSNSSCTCLVTSGLPVVIPSHGETVLRVSAARKVGLRQYSERVRVLTNSDKRPLVLSVRGSFR